MQNGPTNGSGNSFQQGGGHRSGPVGGDDFKELVRSHTDIVSLIGEKVALRPEGGGKYKGLCPFHDDSNPSFTVSPDYGSYKCWACNEAGDAFSFVMKLEKLDFRGALELLARRAGLEMPTYGNGPKGPKRDEQLAALEWANEQFVNALWDGVAGEEARDYYRGRNFSDETIEQWGLGFHPEDWTYLLKRARSNFSIEVLDAARLIKKSERSGDWLDQFVGRVMFPIRNDRGQIVAFGGRVLPRPDSNDERGPKYLNSSDSPYFSKQRILYGLDIAKQFLEKAGRAIVVEGYTDCITLHQAGITNAVGVLGTALTEHHARLLKRFTNQVVLVFDGDAAGQKAAERSLGTLLASEIDVRVMALPDGLDPDEFLARYSAEELQHRAANAPEAWRWKFDTAVERHGLDTLDGRNRVLDEILRIFVGVSISNVRVEMLLATIAQRVGVSEQAVRQRLGDVRNATASRVRTPDVGQEQQQSKLRKFVDRVLNNPNRDDRIERTLLEELLASPEHFSVASENVAPEDFRNEALRRLFLAMSAVAQGLQDQSPNVSQPQSLPNYENVMAKLTHPELKRLLIVLDESVRERHRRVTPEPIQQPGGRQSDGSRSQIPFPDACPPVIRRPIEQIRWRRDEQSHRQLARQLDDPAGGTRPDESDEALMKVAEFHRRRAAGGHNRPPK